MKHFVQGLLFVFGVATLGLAQAQEITPPRPSPLAVVHARYKNTYLKITYSQPHKNGRKIFGSLVPYGQVWRTGANEATEITISQDIQLNGSLVRAGTYSVFSIPQEDHWTIIINSEPGLWGAYNYNDKLDVLRLDVPVQHLTDASWEAFTISIEQKTDKADIHFLWDDVNVSLAVQFQEPKP